MHGLQAVMAGPAAAREQSNGGAIYACPSCSLATREYAGWKGPLLPPLPALADEQTPPPPSPGVTVSLLRMLTKATLPGTPAGIRQSAGLYFAVAACVCLACAAVHSCVLPRLGVVRRRRSAMLAAALLLDPTDEELAAGGALNPRLPAVATERAGTPPPWGPDEIQLTPLGSPTRALAWPRPQASLPLSPESLFAGKWSCASSATLADFAAAPRADAWRASAAPPDPRRPTQSPPPPAKHSQSNRGDGS